MNVTMLCVPSAQPAGSAAETGGVLAGVVYVGVCVGVYAGGVYVGVVAWVGEAEGDR